MTSPTPTRWSLLLAIAALVVAADQTTKFLAVQELTGAFEAAHAASPSERLHAFVSERALVARGLAGAPAPVIRTFWQHRYLENPGAAFSLLGNASQAVRGPFFTGVLLLAVVLVTSFYRRTDPAHLASRVGWSLVLGGALSNAVDRILHGYVIDFIDWHWDDPDWLRPSLHWATFNLADACICVGVGLLLVASLRERPARAPVRAAEPVSP